MLLKMMLLSVVILVSLLENGFSSSSAGAVEVFYVRPTEPTTECPSGDSPCHSLQYYANHSSFTNNSRFLFLEGEHHLDGVVSVRNVANLSLVGDSSGVKILCGSLPSGFDVEEFSGLSFEDIAISNCTGTENVALSLATGSELSLNHVTITSSPGHDTLLAVNVVGSLSIFDSTFFGIAQGDKNYIVIVYYSFCDRPSYFNFSNNNINSADTEAGIELDVEDCSDVHAAFTDSILLSLFITIRGSTNSNNSIVVSKSRAYISINFYNKFYCNSLKNTIILIENSTLNGRSGGIDVTIVDSNFVNTPQITLRNVVISNHFSSAAVFNGAVVVFVNCTFENNAWSAITAAGSEVIFQGNHVFKNNSAHGGIHLIDISYMTLRPYTNILFEGNHADYVGGAIYSDDEECFFYLDIDSPELNETINIDFINNTAGYAGSSLYGGIKDCIFYHVLNISNTETDPSAVTSGPHGVCFCDDGKRQPNCSYSNEEYQIHAFPGQEFKVRLAVVDGSYYFTGAIPGVVGARIHASSNATLGSSQSSQASNYPYCSTFSYSVSSITEESVKLELSAEQTHLVSRPVTVRVHLMECPLGFPLSQASGKCECDPAVKDYDIECDVNNQSFLRPANSGSITWVGFISESSSKPGVMFHPNCPIGYCLLRDVNITINTSDGQCEPHRTGLLCGECEEGYSLTLGNEQCVKCSNIYLLLLLPLAGSGLFLVAILFVLNLTVTEGSINGLIFYANVLAMNHSVRLSGEVSYLYTFLAWINLDLGISTCLYNGMDAYAEIWLQFIFPAYLWVIILVIILFYRKSPSLANRLGGENAVKVLATLLLLSYTKLQRIVVTIMSFTRLEYPDGVVRYVWQYDANVEFFKGIHLFLGIAGILVLIFIIVPYTLCLAFFQQLQACSGHRLFQWVNKLKPVFDSYAGPYKDKYRFWTGLLLLIRTLLIILFTINTAGSVELNLLIILVVSCTLLLANTNGAYKKFSCNYLESFFYLQLAVFAGGLAYARHIDGNITAVADTSFGLTLIVFLAVLGYHAFCRAISFRRRNGYEDIVDEELPAVYHHRITD